MFLSGSLVGRAPSPIPIKQIQSNLRQPGVIDGAPLIWPPRTSASRFTTVETGRFGTGSGKNTDTCTQLRSFALSISFSLSQLHYNEDPHQDPASIELQNKYAQHHLSLCLQTQSLNAKHEHEACKFYTYTPNIISIHRRKYTHTYSSLLPLLLLTEEIYRAVEQKSGLHRVQIIIWWKSPAFH